MNLGQSGSMEGEFGNCALVCNFVLTFNLHRPGSSSMDGLFNENGPLRVALQDGDTTGKKLIMTPNSYSWTNLTDMFYVDQPVGTGYSTADRHGYVADQDQVGEDFVSHSL